MKAVLNVGLLDNRSGELIADDVALEAVKKFVKILDYRFADSSTERTLIAEVIVDEWYGTSCFAIALLLHQDCIAIRFDHYGQLIGPCAESWGEFNPDFFLPIRPIDTTNQWLLDDESAVVIDTYKGDRITADTHTLYR